MKKVFAILLIPLFLIAAQGMAITSLYCQGKAVQNGLKIKPCCKDVNKGGCCKTESRVLKLKENLTPGIAFDVKFSPGFTILFHSFNFFRKSIVRNAVIINHPDKSTPDTHPPLYLVYRTLLI